MKRSVFFILILSMLAPACLRVQAAGKKLTVGLVSDPSQIISPRISRIRWRPGTDEVTYIRPAGSEDSSATVLDIYDTVNRKERVLFQPGGETSVLNLSSYVWSPKGGSILFTGDNDLWIFTVQTQKARRLTHDDSVEELATFSPAGDRVAFVEKNDLYVVEISTGRVTRLTHDGSTTVSNGKLDWVYEEELANRAGSPAYAWSPDGKMIAYLRLDDAPVPQYPITGYLSTHATLYEQRFPQAGDPNPAPSLHVATVGEGNPQERTFPLPPCAGGGRRPLLDQLARSALFFERRHAFPLAFRARRLAAPLSVRAGWRAREEADLRRLDD
jgi:Tol biopolymer transport system component